MKKLITFVFITVTSLSFGQHEFGIRAGLNASQITGPTGDGKIDTYFNTNYNYLFNDHWVISTGFEFERKGDYELFSYTNNGNNYTSEQNTELDYYSVPLTMGYRFGDRLFGAVRLGIIGRYLHYGFTGNSLYQNNDLVYTSGFEAEENFTTFDWGGVFELNGGYVFSDHHSLSITTRLSHGFQNIYRPLPNDALAKRNRGVVVALGYTYRM